MRSENKLFFIFSFKHIFGAIVSLIISGYNLFLFYQNDDLFNAIIGGIISLSFVYHCIYLIFLICKKNPPKRFLDSIASFQIADAVFLSILIIFSFSVMLFMRLILEDIRFEFIANTPVEALLYTFSHIGIYMTYTDEKKSLVGRKLVKVKHSMTSNENLSLNDPQ